MWQTSPPEADELKKNFYDDDADQKKKFEKARVWDILLLIYVLRGPRSGASLFSNLSDGLPVTLKSCR